MEFIVMFASSKKPSCSSSVTVHELLWLVTNIIICPNTLSLIINIISDPSAPINILPDELSLFLTINPISNKMFVVRADHVTFTVWNSIFDLAYVSLLIFVFWVIPVHSCCSLCFHVCVNRIENFKILMLYFWSKLYKFL